MLLTTNCNNYIYIVTISYHAYVDDPRNVDAVELSDMNKPKIESLGNGSMQLIICSDMNKRNTDS